MNKLLLSLSSLLLASMTAVSAQAQQVTGDAKAGEKKIAMCIGCHGIKGYQASFPEVYKVPKISGQNAAYIAAALDAYKKGERKHPTMRSVAEALSDQDIADVAAYYEGHGKVAGAAEPKLTPANEKVTALISKGACVSCHGDNFSKPVSPTYPKVAGQNADYLYAVLKAYKTEGSAQMGRANGIMSGVVKQFSNDELKALANYLGAQAGELQTIPQAHFR